VNIRVKFSLPNIVSAVGRVIHGTGFRLHIPAVTAMQLPTIEEEEEETFVQQFTATPLST